MINKHNKCELFMCCFSLLADHSLVFNEALSTNAHLIDICDIINTNSNLKEKILDLSNMAQVK